MNIADRYKIFYEHIIDGYFIEETPLMTDSFENVIKYIIDNNISLNIFADSLIENVREHYHSNAPHEVEYRFDSVDINAKEFMVQILFFFKNDYIHTLRNGKNFNKEYFRAYILKQIRDYKINKLLCTMNSK